MRKYSHYFETENDYNSARTNNYVEPWVSYTKETSTVTYNKTEREKPLTFEISSPGNIYWKAGNSYTCTIEYKKNDGEWTSITSATGSSAPSISVVAGDTVQFRGDNATYSSDGRSYNSFGNPTCQFKVKGNIMSLIDSADFATATTLQSANTFYSLFSGCAGLTDAGDLLLPATTLTDSCYGNMFDYCTGLTTAPVLPATTLANGCYKGMFMECRSLTTAPELPATTLANDCYRGMFRGCTGLTTAPSILPATTLADYCYHYMFYYCPSLTTAPELPATTLANYCYYSMFDGCTNLNYIKCLATNISASNCTYEWVNNVAASGTFIKNANMSSWTTGVSGIPTNWTVRDNIFQIMNNLML